jgi:broad specificity phosphatase PhoE
MDIVASPCTSVLSVAHVKLRKSSGNTFPFTAPIREPRIREVTIGSWDGLTHEDIDAGWPGMLHGSDRFNWYFRAPNGEAYDQAVNRVVAWLAEVQGTVVAVSHGLTGRLIRGAYLGLPRREALSLPVPQDIVWRLADSRIEALRATTDD